ncbi:MAG: TlpA family protein disulfide reductase [Phycisphaerales bacterium JB059]
MPTRRVARFARLVPALFALCLAAPLASAQGTDGQALMRQAAEAIRNVDALSVRMTLEGGGSKSFLQFMPSGEGVFRAKRVENDEGELVWATRIQGAGKDKGDGEEYTFDVATRGDSITWVEHRSKSVNTNTIARARGVGLSMRQHMNLDELLSPEPLARELNATEYEVLDRATIGGVECDVVRLVYPQGDTPTPSRGKALPNKATWFLGAEDHLPRRIERTTDADIIAISLILTMEDLTLEPEISDDQLKVAVPDGYREIEPRTSPVVNRVARPTNVTRTENAEVAKPTPKRTKAPSFSVKDASGAEVSNQTQEGRVSVIYFWGTWCVPCRNYSPLISGLAETFAEEPVDILAPAVRSDPGKARQAIREKGYRQRLLVEADEMARAFRVRIYPTVFVIDAEGGIVATEAPTRGETPEEMVKRIEQLVRDELARMGDG